MKYRFVVWGIVAAALASAVGCRTGVLSPDADLLSSLRFSPSAFDSFRRNTELHYSLSAPAELQVRIIRRDQEGRETLIRILATRLSETKGAHAITWLGDTSERLFAPAGRYIGVVQIGGSLFEAPVEVFHF